MALIVSESHAQIAVSPPTSKDVHENIHYYSPTQMEEMGIEPSIRVSLDVYEPENGRNLPVVVFVHGGAWQAGDKTRAGRKPDYFLSQGFVFVSTNYRFRPHVPITALQRDVAAAVAWVNKNIERYRGDPEKLFLLGHSAGAHLVCMVGIRPDLLEEFGSSNTSIKAIADLDTRALDIPLLMDSVGDRFAPIFGTDPTVHKEVSPYHHIVEGRYTPPILFLVANNNQSRITQSRRMAEKLRSVGIISTIVQAPDRTHGTLNRMLGSAEDGYGETVVRFFRESLSDKAQ